MCSAGIGAWRGHMHIYKHQCEIWKRQKMVENNGPRVPVPSRRWRSAARSLSSLDAGRCWRGWGKCSAPGTAGSSAAAADIPSPTCHFWSKKGRKNKRIRRTKQLGCLNLDKHNKQCHILLLKSHICYIVQHVQSHWLVILRLIIQWQPRNCGEPADQWDQTQIPLI